MIGNRSAKLKYKFIEAYLITKKVNNILNALEKKTRSFTNKIKLPFIFSSSSSSIRILSMLVCKYVKNQDNSSSILTKQSILSVSFTSNICFIRTYLRYDLSLFPFNNINYFYGFLFFVLILLVVVH